MTSETRLNSKSFDFFHQEKDKLNHSLINQPKFTSHPKLANQTYQLHS